MALTDAKRRANNKTIAKTMTVLGCKVRKEAAEQYHAAAAAQDTTVNAVMRRALDEMLSATNHHATGVEEIVPPEHLERTGETAREFFDRAVAAQIKRDNMALRMGANPKIRE